MGKRMVFTAICLILVILIYNLSYLEMRGDVSFGEMVFNQAVKEAMNIYSPTLLYLTSNMENTVDKAEEVLADDIFPEALEDEVKETIIEPVIEPVMETVYSFTPATEPVAVYLEEQLKDPAFLKQTFYMEDATTYISEEQLDYDRLSGFDAVMKQSDELPQILIYHTHSQEAYADSTPGDSQGTIMAVGEYLASILQSEYGFNVIHHQGQYDIDGRDYAYSNAMQGISMVLENNPSIEVMIDLHRDETNADTRLVTTIQGKEMARFMFFNGLCYTRELGKLENLTNPYIDENLAFAFQMQLFADEYYPGLTRRIYLKGYRYNMHFRPKSLLIELGSQTNTVEEAMNSCGPIAHIIASVLNGENK